MASMDTLCYMVAIWYNQLYARYSKGNCNLDLCMSCPRVYKSTVRDISMSSSYNQPVMMSEIYSLVSAKTWSHKQPSISIGS